MSEQTNRQDQSAKPARSNTVFFVVVASILMGTAGWYAMTLLGSEPIGVERAKEMAKEFERECFLDLQDDKRCKALVGQYHRECLFENIERVPEGQGDDGSGVKHDREGYLGCMRERTGVGIEARSEGAR